MSVDIKRPKTARPLSDDKRCVMVTLNLSPDNMLAKFLVRNVGRLFSLL